MNLQNLIHNISDKALKTDDDVESNMLSALAERLSNLANPFEKPLTAHEKFIVNSFIHG